MKARYLVLLLLLAGLTVAPAIAETVEEDTAIEETAAEEEKEMSDAVETEPDAGAAADDVATAEAVVVTANRRATELKRVPQRVDLVTREAIDRVEGEQATDLLKKTTAIEIVQYPGALSGVGVRGFAPSTSSINKRTLLVVDGRPTSSFNIASVNIHSIERIEVLKGPGSALFGSSAMGGVVNIIRKKSKGSPLTKVGLTLGSYGTHGLDFASGGSASSWLDYDLIITNLNREQDYRSGSPKDQTLLRTSTFNQSGNLRMGVTAVPGWRMDVVLDGIRNKVGTPDDVADNDPDVGYKHLTRYSADVSLEGDLFGTDFSAVWFSSREENVSTKAVTHTATPIFNPAFGNINKMDGFQVRDSLTWVDQTLTLGVDYSTAFASSQSWAKPFAPNFDYAQPKSPFAPDAGQLNVGYFGQLDFNLLDGRITANVGGRQDQYTSELKETAHFTNPSFMPQSRQFSHFSPSGGIKAWLTSWGNVHASGGSAFVVPNADQLAMNIMSGSTLNIGNPNLKPESSVGWDVGVGLDGEFLGVDTLVDVTYYSNDVTDFIESYAVNATTNSYRNVSNTTEIRGLEIQVSKDFGSWFDWAKSLRLYWNFNRTMRAASVDATTGEASRNRLISPRRYNYGLSFDDGRYFSLDVMGRHWGGNTDLDFNQPFPFPTIIYPEMDTLDLTVTVRPLGGHSVTAKVANVFDTFVYEKAGYPMPGRTITGKYSYEF